MHTIAVRMDMMIQLAQPRRLFLESSMALNTNPIEEPTNLRSKQFCYREGLLVGLLALLCLRCMLL
jgi:hypothetical protein